MPIPLQGPDARLGHRPDNGIVPVAGGASAGTAGPACPRGHRRGKLFAGTGRRLGAGLLLLALGPASAGTERVEVLRDGDVAGWEEKSFKGKTIYERVRQDGRVVLRATSRGTASGLYRRLRIDLEKTPILHWTWRVEATLGDVDERTRAGDDYSARVYVIRSHPVFAWRTRAVNYVWASARAEGETWPNAYTGSARHVAVRSGDAHAGRWVGERRDVRADFRALFGEDVRYVDAIAIMTDTDDTGGAATAYYGDVTFTSE